MSVQPTQLSTRAVTRDCPRHGKFITEVLVSGPGAGTPVLQRSQCPKCRQEQHDKRAAAAMAEQEAKRKNRIQYLLDNCGVPARYRDADFTSFKVYGDHQQRAHMGLAQRMIRQYANNFGELGERGVCLILCGGTGTGKTHLACAAANHVIRHHGASAIYTTVLSLMKEVRKTYGRNSITEGEVLANYTAPDLLVLDEVGVQYANDNELVTLYDVINGRYENVRSTVLISNLDQENLMHFIGARSVDRLRENGGAVLEFDWETYRSRA